VSDTQESFEQAATRWVNERVLRAAGKPVGDIPDGSYCYSEHFSDENIERMAEFEKLHPEESGEQFVLWVQLREEKTCPYWQRTDHGTFRCNFIEDEAVGWREGDHEKALSHFGSEAVLEERCQGSGFELGDQVRCCSRVMEALAKVDPDTVGSCFSPSRCVAGAAALKEGAR
jgi:hypothetical protein